jgi:hypothetical protein
MTNILDAAFARPRLLAVGCALAACSCSRSVADQCAARYPRPTDAQIAADTTSVPAPESLAIYQPSDSLPQVFSSDSSAGWFRNLLFAHFTEFHTKREVHSFLLRFHARIVGQAATAGWHAVLIPDPGPDTARFNLLLHCTGAALGVWVRPVYSRRPSFFPRDTGSHVLPNPRLQRTGAAP